MPASAELGGASPAFVRGPASRRSGRTPSPLDTLALVDPPAGLRPVPPDRRPSRRRPGSSARTGAHPPRSTAAGRWRRDLPVVALVALGGVLGALARDALESAAPATSGQLPWTTLAINLAGSFALGLLLVLLAERFPGARLVRPLLGTGLIGAFTTFSTFVLEAFDLIRTGHVLVAVIYLTASLFGGLLCAAAGLVAARFVLRLERRLREQP